MNIGSWNELTIARAVDFGMYLTDGENDVLLPAKYIPDGYAPGDKIKVFLYTDSEDRPIATTQTPKGTVGDFAVLQVVSVQQFGAFAYWGLEKELLIPISQQQHLLEPGQKAVVRICLDVRTNRVFGTTKIRRFFEAAKDVTAGDKVDCLVYAVSQMGALCVVENRYGGLLPTIEQVEDLKVGDRVSLFVRRVKEDGRIDLGSKEAGFAGVVEAEQKVLDRLQAAGGFLPYGDWTPPDVIYKVFKMSKGTYKKAIGALYRQGRVDLRRDGIKLKT